MTNDRSPRDSLSEADQVLLDALVSDDDEVFAEVADDLFALLDDTLALEIVGLLRKPQATERRRRLAYALGPVLEAAHDAQSTSADAQDALSGNQFMAPSPLTREGVIAVSDALEAIYRDATVPGDVRRAVLETAVRAPADWQEGAVRAAWGSEDEAWRLTAIFAMGHLFSWDFRAELWQAWRSASTLERRQALLAAAERGLVDFLPEATRVSMNDAAVPELRQAAVELLGALGDESHLEALASLARAKHSLAAEAGEARRRILSRSDPAEDLAPSDQL